MSPLKASVIAGLFAVVAVQAITVNFSVNTLQDRAAISPYVYGANGGISDTQNVTARRSGGNRLTGYNWENNYSHAGNDWYNYNDNLMVSSLPSADQKKPGIAIKNFVDNCNLQQVYSLVTLQMAGYVSADGNGTVNAPDAAPSARFKAVKYAKGAPFTLTPDPADSFVYIDEFVNYLTTTFGKANTPTGVKAYSLDNEPALWSSTHARIHPVKVTCKELIDRTIALSSAVKNVDSTAEIYGAADYGMRAYWDLQFAVDWPTILQNYADSGIDTTKVWFVDYYLEHLKKASDSLGRRLLDVYDFHWYPEARDSTNTRIVFTTTNTRILIDARVRAPRSLWDTTYHEKSWILAQCPGTLPLLPRLKSSIDKYYPGTKLGMTEFDYGGGDHVSGGIALADVLGIIGKYGMYSAFFWQTSGVKFPKMAYGLFRNYDGKDSKYGDVKVYAETNDWANSSVYASVAPESDSVMHLIAINKNQDSSITVNAALQANWHYVSAEVWGFDAVHNAIYQMAGITSITDNTFSYTIPKLTACHIIVHSDYARARNMSRNNAGFMMDISAEKSGARNILRYILPVNEKISLVIRSLQGKTVMKLGEFSGRGSIALPSTRHLSSGIYFVDMKNTDFSRTVQWVKED